ncbi:MAG: hypothetical protein DRP64_13510 [Verrucomicrobia bacterium]|nr:MAG: hypothetical protein DRP64_13510 [Verrucomicrobiota bacterium]
MDSARTAPLSLRVKRYYTEQQLAKPVQWEVRVSLESALELGWQLLEPLDAVQESVSKKRRYQ